MNVTAVVITALICGTLIIISLIGKIETRNNRKNVAAGDGFMNIPGDMED